MLLINIYQWHPVIKWCSIMHDFIYLPIHWQIRVVDSFCYYVTRRLCRCFKSLYSTGLGRTTDSFGRISTWCSGNVILVVKESWDSSKFLSGSSLDLVWTLVVEKLQPIQRKQRTRWDFGTVLKCWRRSKGFLRKSFFENDVFSSVVTTFTASVFVHASSIYLYYI